MVGARESSLAFGLSSSNLSEPVAAANKSRATAEDRIETLQSNSASFKRDLDEMTESRDVSKDASDAVTALETTSGEGELAVSEREESALLEQPMLLVEHQIGHELRRHRRKRRGCHRRSHGVVGRRPGLPIPRLRRLGQDWVVQATAGLAFSVQFSAAPPAPTSLSGTPGLAQALHRLASRSLRVESAFRLEPCKTGCGCSSRRSNRRVLLGRARVNRAIEILTDQIPCRMRLASISSIRAT